MWVKAGGTASLPGFQARERAWAVAFGKAQQSPAPHGPVETVFALAHSSAGCEGSMTCSGLCCIFHPQTQPTLTRRLPAAGLALGSGREGPLNLAVLSLSEQMCDPDETWWGQVRAPLPELFIEFFSPQIF